MLRGERRAPLTTDADRLGEALADELLEAARPLAGRTVVVTRAQKQAGGLVGLLEARGAQVVHFPTIRIVDPPSWEPLDEALARLDGFDWLLFTSANAARRVLDRRPELGTLCETGGVRVVAVGEATEAPLHRAGVRLAAGPAQAQAEVLASRLAGEIDGRRFLLPRAERATNDLPRILAEEGALEVCEVTVYRTVSDGGGREKEVRLLLQDGRIDWLTFTSGSTLDAFEELIGLGILDGSRLGARVATIGPRTSRRVQERGGAVVAEATVARAESLVESIVRYERRRGGLKPAALSEEELN